MQINMASTQKITTLEQCRIAPTSGAAGQMLLPLTFFDMFWLHYKPTQYLLFYEFPCSKTHFMETIVPNLKHSLSLTLKHFLPLAGNLIYPSEDTGKPPEFRYVTGDSVSLTFAESSDDFDYLTGNHSRNADDFYPLVPELPRSVTDLPAGCKLIPLLALQVTLFPDRGICIGIVNHHVVADAGTTYNFLMAWGSIHRLGGDSHWLEGNLEPPCYDRSVITYPSELDTLYWNVKKTINIKDFQSVSALPTNKVRARYVIGEDHIKKLKNLVSSRRPSLAHVSSFTVTCAYLWTCLVKSSAAVGEVCDNDAELFGSSVDCRQWLKPPAPQTYFGNCLAFFLARSTRTELMGNEGFLTAAESIGEAIHARLHNDKGILAGAETLLSKMGQVNGNLLAVSGSPKFDLSETDYGWGKSKAFETISIDLDGAMSLSKCRGTQGGLEIGFSLPKTKMDIFAITFANGLKIL